MYFARIYFSLCIPVIGLGIIARPKDARQCRERVEERSCFPLSCGFQDLGRGLNSAAWTVPSRAGHPALLSTTTAERD